MRHIPTAAREKVRARSGGVCERCGQRKPLEMSHRIARGMGGTRDGQGDPALYCHICHDCHRWVEAHPREAAATGYKVPRGESLSWPVQMWDGVRILTV